MNKRKSIKITFYTDTSFIEILPTISIYFDERSITLHWIIFGIDIYY